MNAAASGVTGSSDPIAAATTAASTTMRAGRCPCHGKVRARSTSTTSSWVSNPSTNQPV